MHDDDGDDDDDDDVDDDDIPPIPFHSILYYTHLHLHIHIHIQFIIPHGALSSTLFGLGFGFLYRYIHFPPPPPTPPLFQPSSATPFLLSLSKEVGSSGGKSYGKERGEGGGVWWAKGGEGKGRERSAVLRSASCVLRIGRHIYGGMLYSTGELVSEDGGVGMGDRCTARGDVCFGWLGEGRKKGGGGWKGRDGGWEGRG